VIFPSGRRRPNRICRPRRASASRRWRKCCNTPLGVKASFALCRTFSRMTVSTRSSAWACASAGVTAGEILSTIVADLASAFYRRHTQPLNRAAVFMSQPHQNTRPEVLDGTDRFISDPPEWQNTARFSASPPQTHPPFATAPVLAHSPPPSPTQIRIAPWPHHR
jgi:hypothetical protein